MISGMKATTPPNRKALILGATGLVGDFCLQNLLGDPVYTEITAYVRKPLLKTHRKLKTVITQISDIEHDLSKTKVDDVFCCLGTTIKKAGSQESFKQVDLSLVASIAEFMRKQGAEQLIVISSMGANKNSRVFYNRVKGEMEQVVKSLGYPCLRIIRPSLLLGPRKEFRFGEKMGALLAPALKPFMIGPLKKYRPIQAASVAQFMVKVSHEEPFSGVHFYESDCIYEYILSSQSI